VKEREHPQNIRFRANAVMGMNEHRSVETIQLISSAPVILVASTQSFRGHGHARQVVRFSKQNAIRPIHIVCDGAGNGRLGRGGPRERVMGCEDELGPQARKKCHAAQRPYGRKLAAGGIRIEYQQEIRHDVVEALKASNVAAGLRAC
jgi:hypothetical protein